MDLGISYDPYLGVLLFDIDHDGIPEALVTYWVWNTGGSGYRGRTWVGYQFKDGRWKKDVDMQSEDVDMQEVEDHLIGASCDGFYVLTEKGKKPKLIASSTSVGKDLEGSHLSRNAYHVTIDAKGYIRAIPFPAFTVEDLFVEDGFLDDLPDVKLKSPEDTFEPVPDGSLHWVYPVGKTVVWEWGESEYPTRMAFTKNYVWKSPVTPLFRPDIVMTNTHLLPQHLQSVIVRKRAEEWWRLPQEPMYPEKTELFTLDLEGNGNPVFFVKVGRWDEDFGGECYVIFRQTDITTYPEAGSFRRGFAELALHEKTNGLHSIECHHPFKYGDQRGSVRELFVFDGKRYNIVARSWCKND